MNIRLSTVAAVVSLLAACTYDLPEHDFRNFTTTIYADTPRTSFDETTGCVSWCMGDELALLYGTDDIVIPSYNGTALSTVGGTTGVFRAVLNGTPVPSATDLCRLYALYPQSAFAGAENDRISCCVPIRQAGSAASYDASAGLLYGVSAAVAGAVPEEAAMSFRHIAAYGAITVIPPSAAEISEYVTITAERAIAGCASFACDGTDLSAEEGVGSLTVSFAENERTVRFACIPADLSGTTVTVVLATSAGRYEKMFVPARLKFDAGRTSRFTVDMSQCKPLPQAGDVLWQDDFETAVPTTATNGKAGEVLGEYDPTADGASCRLFGNGDRSKLEYKGSYALYTVYEGAADVRFEGKVFAHKGSADGYVAVENIPVYGVSKAELSFGTNATSCTLTVGYDGAYDRETDIEIPAGELCRVEIEIPPRTETLSLKISGNSKLIRRFDRFRLMVSEE